MARHVVTLSISCPRCRHEGELLCVARTDDDGLRFSTSFACKVCGLVQEGDGRNIPEDARAAFLRTEGQWGLVVSDLGSKRVEALHALRGILQMSPQKLTQSLRHKTPIFVGTLVEVEQLEMALGTTGASLSRVAV